MLFGGRESIGNEIKMTPCKPDSKLYSFHVANLRSLQIAINTSALSARKAIAEENQQAIDTFVRLYAFLLGAWAEVRLSKLLFEQNGFSLKQRNRVLSQNSQLTQWKKAVEVGFRKQYNVPTATLTDTSLPHTAYAQYRTLIEVLERDLKAVIEIRNRLAHGQWIYPLNSSGNDIEDDKYRKIKEENLLSLQFKLQLISILAQIIHDLIVSVPTFERDFNQHYKKITNTINNLKNRKYPDYARTLTVKKERGIRKKRKSRE